MGGFHVGEIRMMSFSHTPQGWAHCDGSLLNIDQHKDLYAVLGTLYGGDGITTFALPDLRGRVPIQATEHHPQGEVGGAEAVTLEVSQLPSHSHTVKASSDRARELLPSDNFLSTVPRKIYSEPTALTATHPGSVLVAGEGQAHDNRQPYLAVNFIISLTEQPLPQN